MGDWSHDGHSQTEVVTIKSTLTVYELKDAYKKGASIVGVDLQKDVARNFEDSHLEKSYYEKFKEAGLLTWKTDTDLSWLDDGDDEVDVDYLEYNSYLHLYLFTVFVGNNKFDYDVIRNIVDIGGYGLFMI